MRGRNPISWMCSPICAIACCCFSLSALFSLHYQMVPDKDSSAEDYEDWNLRTQFQYTELACLSTISNSGNYMDSLLMRVFIVKFFLSNRIWASLLWIPLLAPQWSTQFFPNTRSNLSLYISPLNRRNAVLYTSWCNSGGCRFELADNPVRSSVKEV